MEKLTWNNNNNYIRQKERKIQSYVSLKKKKKGLIKYRKIKNKIKEFKEKIWIKKILSIIK